MQVSVTYQFTSEADAAAFMAGKVAGGGKTTTGTTETKVTKTETKPSKPKNSKAEVTAALNEVKDKFDAATAKGIIKDVGGVDKLADIPEAKYGDVYEAAKAKVAESDEGGDPADDDM